MQVVTDSERREVARRLREKSRKYALELSSSHTSTNAYHEVREVLYGTDGAPKSLCEFFDRLADLIEPGCDRDALLALADKLECDGDCNGCDMGGGIWCGAQVYAARRIREACGEVEE